MLKALFSKSKPDAEARARIGAAWQAKLDAQPPSDDPVVVFAIPLIGRKRAQDWTTVCRNLARTMASIRNQTDPRWRVYICGQDRPDGVVFDDKVRFVPFRGLVLPKLEKGMRGYDQGDKRVRLLDTVLRELSGRDGYYARWDADDILHPEVVRHVCEDNNGRGYLIETGIMADVDAGRMGWLAPSDEDGTTKAFWRMCGSSSFVRFDFRRQPRHWKQLMGRLSSHKRLVEWMAVHGMPLEPIPFPAGLYTYNHGENASAIKNNATDAASDPSNRMGYLERNALDAAEAESQVAAFGLDRILAAADQK